MTQQRLMARMGNGLLRQIKDSAEAERLDNPLKKPAKQAVQKW